VLIKNPPPAVLGGGVVGVGQPVIMTTAQARNTAISRFIIVLSTVSSLGS
jgi:hypothetical protein